MHTLTDLLRVIMKLGIRTLLLPNQLLQVRCLISFWTCPKQASPWLLASSTGNPVGL